jgi:hypothetical protein
MKKLLLILLCFPFLVFSQNEKRLALIIGNANYDKGVLKNPVNDALLISETLKQLEFDVILDTNIADKRSFKQTITEFGNRRSDYDVALVYYAGHGIEIDNQNFLLPTKEEFASEYDVQDYGVSVQDIMSYICGDDNYYNSFRAFSTLSGSVASDGVGDNSLYCESLCKNMLVENISIATVFRNVRKEMIIKTDGNQKTQDFDYLVGEEFYFSKSTSNKGNIFILDISRDNPFRKGVTR